MKRAIPFLIVAGLFLAPAGRANAITVDLAEYPLFNPNHILSDTDLFDENGLSLDRVIHLLRSKGTLADQRLPDIDGIVKSIPDIIWRVSRTYRMNPKYLIALLQKEQSLVEDPAPEQNAFDWATGYGVCDSCSKDDPDLQELKGFANQLEWAAKQHREKYLLQLLMNGLTIGGYGVGKPATIDGMVVVPANKATAMLYSYTPHIHGNLNLWKIWNRWFRAKFPDGTLVRGEPSGISYLIRFDEKRPYASDAVLASLVNPDRAIAVPDTDLDTYPTGNVIKFPKWALLRESDGTIYLFTGTEKRHIADMETFRKFGFNTDEIIEVGDGELAEYPNGTEITLQTEFPQGVLMRLAGTDGVYYVEDGVRRPIIDDVFLQLYFRGRRVQDVDAATISQYELAAPYRLHDGELIRSQDVPTVYVIEHGILRPIPTEDAFLSVGWDWQSVVFLSDSLITLYDIGEAFDPNGEPTTILATQPL